MKNLSFYKENVIILTGDKKLYAVVKKVVKSLNLELTIADDIIDLFAIGAFVLIVDSSEINDDFLEIFREVFDAENPKEFVVILTEPIKIPRDIRRYFSFLQPGDLETQIKTTILNRRTNFINRQNNKKDYTKKLNRLFVILRYLQIEGNYVIVSDFAKEFGVSEKTIKRDLQFLREVGGEDIRYHIDKKGYYLDNSLFS